MIKVACWNVNSIQARLDRTKAFIEREKPDILCLQELKCIGDKFPKAEFEALGYQAQVWGQKAYNGVAVLTRAPSRVVQQGLGWSLPDQDEAARLIGVEVSGIHVYSVYVPNGQAVGSEKYQYKLSWLKKLQEFLHKNHSAEKETAKPYLLCGDFNIAPTNLDCHDPQAWEGKILFSEAEKAALKEICENRLQDTFRKHHPTDALYSWWDYRELSFPKNKGLRIDFILASPSLYKRCESASIDRDERKGSKPSDHAPVLATFS